MGKTFTVVLQKLHCLLIYYKISLLFTFQVLLTFCSLVPSNFTFLQGIIYLISKVFNFFFFLDFIGKFEDLWLMKLFFFAIMNSSTTKTPYLPYWASKSANKWLKKNIMNKICDSRPVCNGGNSIVGLKMQNDYGTIHFSHIAIVILDLSLLHAPSLVIALPTLQ